MQTCVRCRTGTSSASPRPLLGAERAPRRAAPARRPASEARRTRKPRKAGKSASRSRCSSRPRSRSCVTNHSLPSATDRALLLDAWSDSPGGAGEAAALVVAAVGISASAGADQAAGDRETAASPGRTGSRSRVARCGYWRSDGAATTVRSRQSRRLQVSQRASAANVQARTLRRSVSWWLGRATLRRALAFGRFSERFGTGLRTRKDARRRTTSQPRTGRPVQRPQREHRRRRGS